MDDSVTRSGSRRRFLTGAGAAAGVALAGCLGGGGPDLPDETPTGPVASAPVPPQPDGFTYATAGSGDAPVQATYFGNWKCPFCADFSTGSLADIVTDYVEPGDVDLTYRALAYIGGDPFLGSDAPRAARAGLAVWNADPGTYWRFHEYVMANQPPESETWATVDTLVSMAEKAGVADPDAVRTALEDGEYESAVSDTSSAAAELGVRGTPALAVAGEVVNPLQTEQARSLLDSAVESA